MPIAWNTNLRSLHTNRFVFAELDADTVRQVAPRPPIAGRSQMEKPNGSGLFNCIVMPITMLFCPGYRNDKCQDHLVLTKQEGSTTH